MAVRTEGNFYFGILWVRFMAMNDDSTLPSPDRIMGGAGPFDFSGVDNPATVPMSVKIDNGETETRNVDISGAADIEAVTVEELVDAINAAGFAEVTASVDITTGRVLIQYNGTEDVYVLQVWGICAELGRIGQGLGCQFIRSNTIQSINVTPVRKDEERIAITDAQGKDTEILTDGYRKGFTAVIVDTVEDLNLLELIEGGTINDETGEYTDPTSESEKKYFYIEAFYGRYSEGENKEADMTGVRREFYQSCKGTEGDANRERNWKNSNYNITGTSYKDENEDIYGASRRLDLSVEEWEALDVKNV